MFKSKLVPDDEYSQKNTFVKDAHNSTAAYPFAYVASSQTLSNLVRVRVCVAIARAAECIGQRTLLVIDGRGPFSSYLNCIVTNRLNTGRAERNRQVQKCAKMCALRGKKLQNHSSKGPRATYRNTLITLSCICDSAWQI